MADSSKHSSDEGVEDAPHRVIDARRRLAGRNWTSSGPLFPTADLGVGR